MGGAVCSDWTIADLATLPGYKAAVAFISLVSHSIVGNSIGRGC
jgi:hypothetical protein